MQEPIITINGNYLSVAQSMAVRVALNAFLMELQNDSEALGEDSHGKFMCRAYKSRMKEIFAMINDRERTSGDR